MRSQPKKTIVLQALALILPLLALSACNLPAGTTAPTQLPPEAYYTEAAVTIEARLTQTALARPSDTPTPLPPTETPTLEPTSTPAFTPTSAIPLISASVGTNCRLGPGTVYDPPVGVLLVGQKAEVHGRNDAGTWWYISNPGKPGQYCWVWGQTTQVEGDTSGLPVITPPPPPPTATFTPTPGAAYSASFDSVHACGGEATAIFKIVNTGGVEWHSLSLKIEDLTTAIVLYGPSTSDAPFMGTNAECPPGGDVLKVGKTAFVGGSVGSGTSGHAARGIIRLCSQNGLAGVCVDKVVEFTIP